MNDVSHTLACVASVSNRVIARTLERKQKKVEGGGGGEKRFLRSPPPPPSFIFFAPVLSQLSRRTSRGNACYAGYSHVKKTLLRIRIANNRDDTSNQKPQRCESFAPKVLPFIGACSLQRPRFLVRFLIRQQLVRNYRT